MSLVYPAEKFKQTRGLMMLLCLLLLLLLLLVVVVIVVVVVNSHGSSLRGYQDHNWSHVVMPPQELNALLSVTTSLTYLALGRSEASTSAMMFIASVQSK